MPAEDTAGRSRGTLAAGTRLGRYEVMRTLGAGGMGHLYLARDGDEVVVLKTLRRDVAEETSLPHLFLREAALGRRFDHPRLMRVLDSGEADGTAFIAMEYVEGTDLAAILRTRNPDPLPLGCALRIAIEVAEGLHAVHEAGVIHRDVSPANVLVGIDGHVTLTDFGIATTHHRTDPTHSDIVRGNIGYLSPEQARGQPLDRRSDVFSLGAVLYEMVTGRPAFPGHDEVEVMRRITRGELEPPSNIADVPLALEKIIRKALRVDPAQRYPTARALHEGLEPLDLSASTIDVGRLVLDGTTLAEPGDRPALPAHLGRHVVLEEAGRGGMGRVLKAYDPKLGREVALKEVAGALLGEDGAARLVTEARAMARVSHPNVVAVYDVERVGGRGVVVVMEYVRGTTLRAWLGERPQRWPAVLARFIGAGRGLAAAHAAGVLHRDFKPSNVLLEDNGRAKVTDFGLAKWVATPASTDGTEEAAAPEITAVGTIVGTRRYMSPEQHRGEALSPASDQYAFCVALWHALCGAPPFDGGRLDAQKRRGPPSWPGPAGVPRRIGTALRRGLAVAPGKRWSSMTALLDELERASASARRRSIAPAIGVAALGALAAGSGTWVASAESCERWSGDLGDVWGPQPREAVGAAMRGVDVPYAEHAWRRTASDLDAYASAWKSTHTTICDAAARAELSEGLVALRMDCLGRARDGLNAVVTVLSQADPRVVERAHALVADLPPPRRCTEPMAPETVVPPPAAAQLRAELAQARARRLADHRVAAAATLAVVSEKAETVGFAPVRIEVAVERGLLDASRGEREAAELELRRALEAAVEAEQWELLRDVAVALMRVADPAVALTYWDFTSAFGPGDERREARARSAHAAALRARDNAEQAEAEQRRVVQLLADALGPAHPEVAAARRDLALTLDSLGHHRAAQEQWRHVAHDLDTALGASHPEARQARHHLEDAG